MQMEYDSAKRAANLRKHGVDLEDATPVLFDPRALVREDADAKGEQRFVAVGMDALGRLLTVVYTYRAGHRSADLGPPVHEERAASL